MDIDHEHDGIDVPSSPLSTSDEADAGAPDTPAADIALDIPSGEYPVCTVPAVGLPAYHVIIWRSLHAT